MSAHPLVRRRVAGVAGATAIALGLLLSSPSGQAGAAELAPKDTSAEVIHGITYLTAECPGKGMEAELADAYLPSPALDAASPAVILVHGGQFVGGSREANWEVNTGTYLASKGWAVFSIDYCMPPRGTPGFPVEDQDVQAAIAMLTTHASSYGIDPQRMAVWGTSAGATLTAQAVTLDSQGQSQSPVVAEVGWSGGYDFTDSNGASAQNFETAANYLGCNVVSDPPKCQATEADASPVSHVTTATPPTMLVNSEHELIPLNQLTDMENTLLDNGVVVHTLVLPGDRHATSYSFLAFCPTVAFLETYLGPVAGDCHHP